MDIGEELAGRVFIDYQDVSKVTSKFVNELVDDYSMYKTTPKEKEQGYGICANNDPPGGKSIFLDALSHMGETTV